MSRRLCDSVTQLKRKFPGTRKGYHGILTAQTKLGKIAPQFNRSLRDAQHFDDCNKVSTLLNPKTFISRPYDCEIRMNVDDGLHLMNSCSCQFICDDPTPRLVVADTPVMNRPTRQSPISVMGSLKQNCPILRFVDTTLDWPCPSCHPKHTPYFRLFLTIDDGSIVSPRASRIGPFPTWLIVKHAAINNHSLSINRKLIAQGIAMGMGWVVVWAN
ncbi:MAG TPA: hypothetical protein DEA71_03630 [Nitrospira sp.]|nr:hypothetical protein [Nitrospira sp.]